MEKETLEEKSKKRLNELIKNKTNLEDQIKQFSVGLQKSQQALIATLGAIQEITNLMKKK